MAGSNILCSPEVEDAVRASFARQTAMSSLGAVLERVGRGEVEISLPYAAAWTQQDGFLHAGILATVLDSACGYAAMSAQPEGVTVLTVEFKANFLAPAQGERFVARARVKRSGSRISVAAADAFAVRSGEEHLVATMLATISAKAPPATSRG